MSERPKYLQARERAANDGGGMVLIGIDQLRAAIRDAVEEATSGRSSSRLLDRQGAAEALACSVAQLDKLRQAGMPCLYVGASPRFVFDDCVRWLAEQKESAS